MDILRKVITKKANKIKLKAIKKVFTLTTKPFKWMANTAPPYIKYI